MDTSQKAPKSIKKSLLIGVLSSIFLIESGKLILTHEDIDQRSTSSSQQTEILNSYNMI